MTDHRPLPRRTMTEEIEVAGHQLVTRAKELVAEGRGRRLRIKEPAATRTSSVRARRRGSRPASRPRPACGGSRRRHRGRASGNRSRDGHRRAGIAPRSPAARACIAGGLMVIERRLSIGALIAFVAYLAFLFGPLQ